MCRYAEPSGAWVESVRIRFEVFRIPCWTELERSLDHGRVITEEDGRDLHPDAALLSRAQTGG